VGPFVVIVRGTSTHLIGQHSRATTKFVFLFLGIISRLKAEIMKLKAGTGFSLLVRQGLSGKHNCFVGGPLKAILPLHSHLLPSGSAIRRPGILTMHDSNTRVIAHSSHLPSALAIFRALTCIRHSLREPETHTTITSSVATAVVMMNGICYGKMHY
jgi:hypothetical protein